jgi:hypothetical protein
MIIILIETVDSCTGAIVLVQVERLAQISAIRDIIVVLLKCNGHIRLVGQSL